MPEGGRKIENVLKEIHTVHINFDENYLEIDGRAVVMHYMEYKPTENGWEEKEVNHIMTGLFVTADGFVRIRVKNKAERSTPP